MKYTKRIFNKHFASLRAFIPNDSYVLDIIKLCNLQHTDNWNTWIDEYNNELFINKNKQILININPTFDNQKFETKDLYLKAKVNKLSEINKFSLISIKDNKYYMWMLDKNNIIRLCIYIDDILMETQPILISGIHNLKLIVSYLNVDGWSEVQFIKDFDTNEYMTSSFATSWPPAKELVNKLPEIIKKDCSLA